MKPVNEPLPAMELYNLADDIAEQHNVAAQHPEVVARLTKLMDEQHIPSSLFPMRQLDRQ
jgi:arylsulfatase A